jgi:hypothetical protein
MLRAVKFALYIQYSGNTYGVVASFILDFLCCRAREEDEEKHVVTERIRHNIHFHKKEKGCISVAVRRRKQSFIKY